MSTNCKYSYYKVDEKRNYLYCNIDNEICPLVRYCQTEQKIVNAKGFGNCKKKKDEDNKMPQGKEKVLFQERGFLYVQISNIGEIRKIKNPYDYAPNSVEIVMVGNEYYINGYEPKEEATKIEVEVEEVEEKPRKTRKK